MPPLVQIAGRNQIAQTVTIAKSGGDFDSIQGAIDSITDAASDKWYAIHIYPGIYNENVVLGNYMELVGQGSGVDDIVISVSSGVALKYPSIAATVTNINVEITPTASGAIAVQANTGGDHQLYLTEVRATSSTNGVTAKLLDIDCDSWFSARHNYVYTMTGSSVGVNTHEIIDFTGTGQVLFQSFIGVVTVNDVDDNIVFMTDDTSGLVIVDSSFANLIHTNAAYSGEFVAYKKTKNTSFSTVFGLKTQMVGAGSGTGIGYEIDTDTNNGDLNSLTSSVSVSNFGLNYFGRAGTGDTINSQADAVNDTDDITGAGTVNFLDSSAYAEMGITSGAEFTIDTTAEWHFVDTLTAGIFKDVDIDPGTTGAITAFADAGSGQVTVTSAGHGLDANEFVSITGTTNYNGVFGLANVTTDTFEITDTWVANDATGTWRHGTEFDVNHRGVYLLNWAFSTQSAGNNKIFSFALFNGATIIPGTLITRKFATGGDIGSISGVSLAQLERSDDIYFAVRNDSDNTNVTLSEGNVTITKQN